MMMCSVGEFKHQTAAIPLVLLIILVGSRPNAARAIDAPRPTLILYITEKPPLTKYRPTLSEKVAIPELAKRGYRILPSFRVRNLPAMCPRDVRGVWNVDRLEEFRKHLNADILWMATVEFKVEKAVGAYPIGGSMSVVACAFSADTGKSLWFRKIESYELKVSQDRVVRGEGNDRGGSRPPRPGRNDSRNG
jgi:hypothetical protein